MVRIYIFLMAAIFSNAAHATYNYDGNEILEVCSVIKIQDMEQHEAMDLFYCMGFIEGVLSSQEIAIELDNPSTVCKLPEEGITTGQIVRIVVKYLEEHPEKLHLNSSLLVLDALRQAFPCTVQQ
jgi:Rap1a immunity proteins